VQTTFLNIANVTSDTRLYCLNISLIVCLRVVFVFFCYEFFGELKIKISS